MSDYSMSYYSTGGVFDDDEPYGYEEEPQPQQNAPRSPGLRAHVKAITAENRQLKKELEEQKAALMELMEGDSPQASNAYPNSRLTQAEILQLTRMQEAGAVGVAAPMNTQLELISRIQNATSPQELMDFLHSQGNTNSTQSYQGMGYQ
ncbi:hypothetical protein [Streptomyces sp. NPDC101776]|uniref:hypothetical protein n=1 Tax=Streptomyces sp. NPDC101776 TaxID=3366146 RepID=UPI003815853F